jgi:hypothetical protein
MEKDAEQIFRKLKEDLSAYVELKVELLKLTAYERTGKLVSVLSYGLILLFLAFFAILFIFLTLGFFLGDILDNVAGGFAIVALLYMILFAIIIFNKNKISEVIVNEIISVLTAIEDKKKESDNEQTTDTAGETDF